MVLNQAWTCVAQNLKKENSVCKNTKLLVGAAFACFFGKCLFTSITVQDICDNPPEFHVYWNSVRKVSFPDYACLANKKINVRLVTKMNKNIPQKHKGNTAKMTIELGKCRFLRKDTFHLFLFYWIFLKVLATTKVINNLNSVNRQNRDTFQNTFAIKLNIVQSKRFSHKPLKPPKLSKCILLHFMQNYKDLFQKYRWKLYM